MRNDFVTKYKQMDKLFKETIEWLGEIATDSKKSPEERYELIKEGRKRIKEESRRIIKSK